LDAVGPATAGLCASDALLVLCTDAVERVVNERPECAEERG